MNHCQDYPKKLKSVGAIESTHRFQILFDSSWPMVIKTKFSNKESVNIDTQAYFEAKDWYGNQAYSLC